MLALLGRRLACTGVTRSYLSRPSAVARFMLVEQLSSRSGGRRPPAKKTRAVAKAPSQIMSLEEAWTEVRDDASGQSYWWNKLTNETTHLGAPRPTGPTALTAPPPADMQQQQQGGGMLSGLGGVMAQGMAFGVGSAVAHRAVGAIANSFSSDDDDGGDDSFDI